MANRKGLSLGELSGMVLAFVVVAIVIGISGTILDQILQSQCSGGVSGYNSTTGACLAAKTTVASNATTQGLSGINTFGTWLPTIAVIVAAAVIIGIIVSYFRQ